MTAINGLIVSFLVLMVIPLWVVNIECLLYLILSKKKNASPFSNIAEAANAAIMIPAHNEEAVLAATLRNLTQEQRDLRRIIVVADNCTDKTADIAKAFNVTVLERTDALLRGKGYALDFGLKFLKTQPKIDVLVILDADCLLTGGSLTRLVKQTIASNKPVQAVYILRPSGDKPGLNQKIASFAWLVKNKIRPLAVALLDLPVTLTGSGMAFPWELISQIDMAHGHLVEDMQLGVDLTLMGYPPQLCSEAEVWSFFPEQQAAQSSQRTRWEHGHLLTILQQVPRIIAYAWKKRDIKLLGFALDIAVPPLALLVLLSLTTLGLLLILSWYSQWLLPAAMLLISLGCFALVILAVWWREGRTLISFRDLSYVPMYIFSKLSIYVAFLFRRQKDWVKTARDDKVED